MTPRSGSYTPARTRASVHRRAAAVLAAGVILLTACSGEGDKGQQNMAEGATMSRTSPLTGKVLAKQPGHPILAVKIDNSGSGRQIGLGKADMVVEELVEGGITRLAAFYYSAIPSDAGPVRSMRATDIGVVAPLKAVLVASGAAAPTAKRVREADIKTVTEGAPAFYRGAGAAPYNLFMDMTKLVEPMKPLADVPAPYLPFGDKALPDGKPAKRFTAVFSQASDSQFEYRDGRYVNTDSYADGGDFSADTVLVLRVRVGLAGYRDPSGFPVPETKFTGKGSATIFHQGRMVTGSWVKDGLEAPLTLRDEKGKELQLRPGQVRIELVPNGTGSLNVG